MQESSLVKWVDELQGQIDSLKRAMQSIPAPEPTAPDVVGTSGTMTIAVSYDESRAEGTATITAALDLANYDYFLNIHYFDTESVGDFVCWDVLNKKITTALDLYVFSGIKSSSGTLSLFDMATLNAVYSEGSISLTFNTPLGFIPLNTAQYVIIGIKKPAATTTSTRKKKSK